MSFSETVTASALGPTIELGIMQEPDAQLGAEAPTAAANRPSGSEAVGGLKHVRSSIDTNLFGTQSGPQFEPKPLQRAPTNPLITRLRKAIKKPEFKALLEPEPLSTAVGNVLEYLRRKKELQGQPLHGYPEFAAFLASDERWMMCRRFSALQARLVLEKQDEVREMEEELQAFDQADWDKHEPGEDPAAPWRLTTRRRRDEEERKERKALFDRAEKTYKEYASLVTAARQMTCCEKPARYEYRNVRRFAEDVKPLPPGELEWILSGQDDIITLRGAREHAYIGAFIEYAYNLYKHTDKLGLSEWATRNSASEKWTGHSISALLLLLVPLMFVVPIYALSRIGDSIGKSIAVLLSFALVFTLILRAVTSARPHEVLGTSAAYLAVLVVFFGSVGRNQNTTSGG